MRKEKQGKGKSTHLDAHQSLKGTPTLIPTDSCLSDYIMCRATSKLDCPISYRPSVYFSVFLIININKVNFKAIYVQYSNFLVTESPDLLVYKTFYVRGMLGYIFI